MIYLVRAMHLCVFFCIKKTFLVLNKRFIFLILFETSFSVSSLYKNLKVLMMHSFRMFGMMFKGVCFKIFVNPKHADPC